MKTEPASLKESGIVEAVDASLDGKHVTPAAEYRVHILKTVIFPMIEKWGYEREFHRELTEMHSKQQRTFDRMNERIANRGAIVALVGDRGLGKTSMTAQLAIKAAWGNHDSALNGTGIRRHVIYRKCAKIVARYKPLFADFGTTETEPLLRSLDYLCREQEVVVIDEVFECEDMKFKRIILTDLIDRRYSCKRDTILISNQSGEEFAKTIGDSILSRLNQYGAILECKWPTYRHQ